jgi:hypothetical protein
LNCFFLFVLLKEKKKNWVSRASNFMAWREVANKEEEKKVGLKRR